MNKVGTVESTNNTAQRRFDGVRACCVNYRLPLLQLSSERLTVVVNCDQVTVSGYYGSAPLKLCTSTTHPHSLHLSVTSDSRAVIGRQLAGACYSPAGPACLT